MSLFFRAAENMSSRAGRVRTGLLPQEYTLTQFISNITTSESSWNAQNPACEWTYVECNPQKEVASLNWGDIQFDSSAHICGSFKWEYMPHTVLLFEAYWQSLTGNLNVSLLPSKLEDFDISTNLHTGTLDFTNLPSSLCLLRLNTNHFEGTVDFTCLPASLRQIDLADNCFCGDLDFTKLPPQIEKVRISRNFFNIPEYVPPQIMISYQKIMNT